MHKIYALCLALVLFAACSESPGNPSLTFSGIDSPGLKLDERAPVFFDVVETVRLHSPFLISISLTHTILTDTYHM